MSVKILIPWVFTQGIKELTFWISYPKVLWTTTLFSLGFNVRTSWLHISVTLCRSFYRAFEAVVCRMQILCSLRANCSCIWDSMNRPITPIPQIATRGTEDFFIFYLTHRNGVELLQLLSPGLHSLTPQSQTQEPETSLSANFIKPRSMPEKTLFRL